MNSVILIGRLTRDPELRYTSGTQMAVATFTAVSYTHLDCPADLLGILIIHNLAEAVKLL